MTRDHEVSQHFKIWVYRERLELVRGSRLFVGENGIAANHHFLLGPDHREFAFTAGRYQLAVVACLVGDHTDKRLFLQEIVLSDEVAAALVDATTGVYLIGRRMPRATFPTLKDVPPSDQQYVGLTPARPTLYDCGVAQAAMYARRWTRGASCPVE